MRQQNINDYDDFRRSGLKPGDRVHLGVVGNHVSDDAVLAGVWEDEKDPRKIIGIKVKLGERVIDLSWGDIVELWGLA